MHLSWNYIHLALNPTLPSGIFWFFFWNLCHSHLLHPSILPMLWSDPSFSLTEATYNSLQTGSPTPVVLKVWPRESWGSLRLFQSISEVKTMLIIILRCYFCLFDPHSLTGVQWNFSEGTWRDITTCRSRFEDPVVFY